MSDSEQPKIIIDDDWKSSAQAEKQRLSEQAEAAAEKPKPGQGLPEKATFDDMLRMLVTQALLYMGAFPDPQTGKAVVALDYAKLHIDLLGVLEEKTKGNLTDEESQTLTETLAELRSQFVEITRYVAKAQAEGTLEQAEGPGAPPTNPMG